MGVVYGQNRPQISLQSPLVPCFAFFMSVHAPVIVSKTLGPSQALEFMGIELDSTRMEARLPKDKLQRTRQCENCQCFTFKRCDKF